MLFLRREKSFGAFAVVIKQSKEDEGFFPWLWSSPLHECVLVSFKVFKHRRKLCKYNYIKSIDSNFCVLKKDEKVLMLLWNCFEQR
jgi:hypothetical protein